MPGRYKKKIAEEELRRSQEQLSLITNELPVLVSYIDANLCYQFLNDAYEKWFSVKKESYIGKSIPELLGEEAYKKILPQIDSVFKGNFVEFESELTYKTGGTRFINGKYIPHFGDNGIVTGYIGLITDITEERKNQENLRIQAQVLDNMSEGVSLADENGIILYTNPAEDKIFGYEPGELIGKHVGVQNNYPEEENLLIVQDVITQLQKTGIWSGEFENIKKDGTPFTTRANITALEMSGKKYWVCVQEDITESKKVQRALLASEEQFRVMSESVPSVIWTADANGVRDYTNKKWAEYTGVENSQAAGFEVIHPDDLQSLISKWKNSVETGEIFSTEFRAKNYSGEYRWMITRAVPLRKESGEIIKWFGTTNDIHDQKINEERLRYHATLTQNIRDAVIGTDSNKNIISWNEGAEKIYGWKAEEVIGTAARGVLETKFISQDSGWEESLSMNGFWQGEVLQRHRDGHLIPIHASVALVRDAAGNIIGGVGVNRDISEEKKIQNALRESEEKFRMMSESVPSVIWTADRNGRTDYINKKWTEMSGALIEDSLGNGWQIYIHPEDRDYCIREWNRAVDAQDLYQVEARVLAADGSYRWQLTRAVPMLDDIGMIVRWFGTINDIHEQKLLQEELNLHKSELERLVQERTEELQSAVRDLTRSNEELEQFAYVASHDLKEPLRMIYSYSQILQKRYKTQFDPEADEFFEFIVEGAGRMNALLNDLLQFSRIGRSEIKLRKINLNEILEIIQHNLKDRIESSFAKITYNNLPAVNSVPTYLVQLFQNLIENGIKFTDGRPPEITISAEDRGSEWLFSVRDTGIGIPEEFLGRIFVIFQRLHTREEYAGTGIGLSICKKIVEFHGGKIWAESEKGNGTTFFFTMPK